MESLLRIGLPVYLVLMFVFAIGGRSYVFWKKTGVNPYKLGHSESVHDLVGARLRLVSLLVLAEVAVFSAFPGIYSYLAPLSWLEAFPLKIAGIVLLVAALVWVIMAQSQMGTSWRIGIDEEHETALVETGLFTISRNPIFLGMRAALAGFFLTMPNALTLLTLVLGDALIGVQVRLEEEYLTAAHGERFLGYRKRVRRWI